MAIGSKAVVGIVIALLCVAIMFPMAYNYGNQISRLNYSGYSVWNTAVQTIYITLVAVLCLIGVALKFLGVGGED